MNEDSHKLRLCHTQGCAGSGSGLVAELSVHVCPQLHIPRCHDGHAISPRGRIYTTEISQCYKPDLLSSSRPPAVRCLPAHYRCI